MEVEDDMLKIHDKDKIEKISFHELTSINLYKPVSLTSYVLTKAAEYQVPVLIYNNTGKVSAWVWSHKYGSIAELRKQQVYFCDSEKGMDWVRTLIRSKVESQARNLKWLADRVPMFKDPINIQLNKVRSVSEGILKADNFDTIRGIEGSFSRKYWALLAIAMSKHIKFKNREKRQPRDQFNQCLNYLYGVLYGIVESSLLMVGIDPYIGIMHVIRHDRPVMAYDHIEPFRPWIDKMLCELFMKGIIHDDHFQEGEYSITSVGRKLLIESFFSQMELKSILNNKNIKRMDHIHYLSSMLVHQIRGQDADKINFL